MQVVLQVFRINFFEVLKARL